MQATHALRRALRAFAYAWAAPNTALGVTLGFAALLCGGWWRLRDGTIEFGGGRLGQLAASLRPPISFGAMTLGHIILGIDGAMLDSVRGHEQVHVRQYERWGPLFLPAYLVSSLVQLLRGRRPYRDNWFEREAYMNAAMNAGAAAAARQQARAHGDDVTPPRS